MRFHGTSWQKVPEAPSWLDLPIKMLNADEGTREAEQILLNDTCPQFVRGLLEAGKPDLEKQGQPAIFTLVLHLVHLAVSPASLYLIGSFEKAAC